MRAAFPLVAPLLSLLIPLTACDRSIAPPATAATSHDAPRAAPVRNSPAASSSAVKREAPTDASATATTQTALSAEAQPAGATASSNSATPPTAVTPAQQATAPAADQPPESDTESSRRLVVRPLRFVPAEGTAFPTITVDAQGKVTWGGTDTATVVGNAIVFSDGTRAATWLDDDRIVVAGWAETFKLTRDDRIEGEQGLRIALDRHGLASVADPSHRVPAHSIGRFESVDAEARPLAELVILIQQIRHPPVPADGGASKPP
ncbi:MAG TPA: hypothetical protein VIV60_29565, partial [Polyangiaceae bacterium]